MVAIVSGNSLGLSLSSLGTLGQRGAFGSASQGRSGETAYVNAATGNLVLQTLDEHWAGQGQGSHGLGIDALRTYNSLGQFNDDNGDNWSMGFYATQLRVTGQPNAVGSSVVRTDRDGAQASYSYAAGRYISTDGSGAYDTISYDATNSQYVWTDGATGLVERYDGSNGRLMLTRDTSGNTLQYAYDGSGFVKSVVDPNNDRSIFFDYSGNQLTQVRIVGAGGVNLVRVQYRYDTSNRLQKVIVDLTPEDGVIADGKTYVTTYGYDGTSKRVASITQSDGSSLAFSYVDGRVSSLNDGLGVTTFAYDTGTRRTTVTDALQRKTVYQYDAAGQLQSVTGPAVNGVPQVTSFDYSPAGDLIKTVDGMGRTVNMDYDANGNQILQRDSAGNTITRSYDARNQLQTETVYLIPDPDGPGEGQAASPQTTRYVYDAANKNQLRFVLSAEGRVSEFRYNLRGERVASVQYTAANYVVAGLAQTEVPSEAQMSTWANLNKVQTQRVDSDYDALGKLQTVTSYVAVDVNGNGLMDGSQSVTQYVYDPVGRLLNTISPKLGTTVYAYDGLGREISRQDANNVLTLTTYDDANNRTVLTQDNGLLTTRSYDKAGRLISTVQSSAATSNLASTLYFYDAAGQLLMSQDPTGVRSWRLYDEAGRKVADIDGTGSLTRYSYNKNNQLVQSVAYATRLTAAQMALLLDSSGKPCNPALSVLAPVTSGADRPTWYAYDTAGRLSKTVDARGAVIESQYDGTSRLVKQVRYATLLSNVGSLAPELDPAAITPALNAAEDRVLRNFYDRDGTLLGTLTGAYASNAAPSSAYLTTYSYDAAGRQIGSTAYAKQPLASAAAGELSSLIPGSDPQDILTHTLYNAQGHRIADVDGEGYLTEYGYDLDGHLSSQNRYAVAVNWTAGATLASLRSAAGGSLQLQKWQYNKLGQLESQTDQYGTVTQYTYDRMGQLIQTDQALGTDQLRSQRSRYDLQGRLIAQLSGEGAALLLPGQAQVQIDAIWSQYAINYAYDAAGRRISSTDQLGQKTLYYYDAADQLVCTINAMGEVVENTYTGLHQLESSTRHAARLSAAQLAGQGGGWLSTALGNALATIGNASLDIQTRYSYWQTGSLMFDRRAEGAYNYREYNAFGELTYVSSYIDASSNLNSYTYYDSRGQVKATTEGEGALAHTRKFTRDSFGRLIEVSSTGFNDKQTFGYDKLGRLIRSTDALNVISTTKYDALGRVLELKDGLDQVTSYVWDTVADGHRLRITTPEQITLTTVYNRFGQTAIVTDGSQVNTFYSYDKNGQLLKQSTAVGLTDSFFNAAGQLINTQNMVAVDTVANTYDKSGRLYRSKDANGNVIQLEYDAANRVWLRTVDPDGPLKLKTQYEFDGMGQQVRITDARQIVTKLDYDLNGQLKSRTVDEGGLNLVTRYSYDGLGRTLGVTDPNQVLTKYTYDTRGRLLQEQVDPSGLNIKRSYTYDLKGNRLTATDPNLQTTRYVYDELDRQSFAIDAMGNIQRTEYDKAGRVSKITRYATPIDIANLASTPTQTQVVALLVGNTSLDQVEHRVYDKDGHQIASVNALGDVKSWSYDASGRVVAQTSYANRINMASWMPGTAPPVEPDSAYDQSLQIVYDTLGRAVATLDGTGAVVLQSYDAVGNLVGRVALANRVTTNSETALDWASLQTAAAAVADAGKDQRTYYRYDAANRETWRINGVGGVEQRIYDANGQLVKHIAYANTGELSAHVGPGGLLGDPLPSAVQANPMDRISLYGYDKAGRLELSVDAVGGLTQNKYDADGNLLHRARFAQAFEATALAAAQADPTLVKLQAGLSLALLADANNRIDRYAYDRANRQTWQMDALGGVTQYRYDALGLLSSKTEYALSMTPTLVTAPELTEASFTPSPDAANDRTTRYFFDAAGRQRYELNAKGYLSETRYSAGRVDSIHYAALPNIAATADTAAVTAALAAIANPTNDRKSSLLQDAAGQTVQSIDALGVITLTEYDGLGRRLKLTQALGQAEQTVSEFEYDGQGRQIKQVTAQGSSAEQTQSAEFNALGQVTREYDKRAYALANSNSAWARGERIRFGLTANAALLTEKQRASLGVSHVYDAAGRRTQTTNAIGASTQTQYDTFGDAVKVTDPLGQCGYFYFDKLGRVTLQVDPLGYGVQTQYFGSFGQEVQSVRRFAAPVAVTGLSPSNPPQFTAQDGKDALSSWTTDRLGRVLSSRDAEGDVESTRYDVSGNRFQRAVSNKLGGEGLYEVDTLGQLVKETLPVQARDGQGNLKAVVNTYSYDAFGQRIGSVEALGLPEQRVTSYRYDAMGRLTHRIGTAYTAYDPVSQSRSSVTPVDYNAYDKLGHLIERIQSGQWNGSQVQGGARSLNYFDAAGNLISQIAPDASLTTSSYDPMGQVITQSAYANRLGALPAVAGGQPPSGIADSANDRTTRYEYDKLGRLTKTSRDAVQVWEQGNTASDGLSLDLAAPRSVTLQERRYDAAGRVTQEIDGRGNSNYLYYDALGRKTLRIDAEGYATGYDYASFQDTATREVKYATQLGDGGSVNILTRNSQFSDTGGTTTTVTSSPSYARQDDTAQAAALRDPILLRQSLESGNAAPTEGSKALRMFYTPMTNGNYVNSSAQRYLGFFDKGDVVTLTVWFKSDSQTTGMAFLGDANFANGTPAYENSVYVTSYGGDGGWKKLTATVTLKNQDMLQAYLYGDRDGGNRKLGSSILYDRLQITSAQKGLVYADSFENGLNSDWIFSGKTPDIETLTPTPDRITEYTLDRLGRVTEKRVKNVEQQYVDAGGAISSKLTDAITRQQYNGLGLITHIDKLVALSGTGAEIWQQTDLSYDMLGRQTRLQAPAYLDYQGASVRPVTDTEYNGLGALSRQIQRGGDDSSEFDDRITRFAYNSNGDRISQTDAAGNLTVYELDAMGHMALSTVKSVLNADGGSADLVKAYQYDALGRMVTQIDRGTGEIRRYAYNAFGEVSGKSLGDGWQEYIQYNTLGNVSRSNTEGGVSKIYLYDSNGNTTRQISSGNSGKDLKTVSVSAAAIDTSLAHSFSVYDKRNKLYKTVEPDISYTQDTAAMNAAFSQQLADLYGTVAVVNIGGGSYGTAGVNGTAGSSTQINGAGSSSLLPNSATPNMVPIRTVGSAPTLGASLPGTGAQVELGHRWGTIIFEEGSCDGPSLPTSFTLPQNESLPYVPYQIFVDGSTVPCATIFPGETTASIYSGILSSGLPGIYGGSHVIEFKSFITGEWKTVAKGGFHIFQWGYGNNFARTTTYDEIDTLSSIKLVGNVGGATSFTAVVNEGFSSSFGLTVGQVQSSGTFEINTSTLTPGTYTVNVRGFNDLGAAVTGEALTITVDATGVTAITGRVTLSASPDTQAILPASGPALQFSASVLGQNPSLHCRANASNDDWSSLALSGNTADLSQAGMVAGQSYEFILSSSAGDKHGSFVYNGPSTAVTLSDSGMLGAVSYGNPAFTINAGGTVSDTTGGNFLMQLNLGGQVFTTALQSDLNFSFADVLSRLGVNPWLHISYAYSYQIFSQRGGVRQFIGQGSGTVTLGSEFSASVPASQTCYVPQVQLSLPGGGSLAGAITLSPQDNPAAATSLAASGDWRRSQAGSAISLDLSEFLPSQPGTSRLINFSYSGADASFSGTYRLWATGQAALEGNIQINPVGQPSITLNVSGAASLSLLKVLNVGSNPGGDPAQAGSVVTTVTSNPPNFSWDVPSSPDGDFRFYYETRDATGALNGKGYGSYKVAGGVLSQYSTDAPLLKPSVASFTPPAGYGYFEVRVGNTLYSTAAGSFNTSGTQLLLNLPGAVPGSSVPLSYRATSGNSASTGNLLSSGTGTLNVGSNGTVSISGQVEDRKPTIVQLLGPLNRHLSTLTVTPGAPLGAAPAYTGPALEAPGVWDDAQQRTVFTWTIPASSPLLPPDSNTPAYRFNYQMGFKNADGSVAKDEIGDPLQIKGVMTLGGSSSQPVQLQQSFTVFNVAAQIKRLQSYNAFGEISEEYDDRVALRAKAMVDQYNKDPELHQDPATAGIVYQADLAAVRTNFVYNALGKLISKADPQTFITEANGFIHRDRPITRYGYDLTGRLNTVTDANGWTSKQSFVGEGEQHLSRQWAADGGLKQIDYDRFGDARRLTNELGAVVEQDFNARSQLITARRLGISRVQNFGAGEVPGAAPVASTLTESYTVNALDQRIAHTDALGQTDKTWYDSLGRVIQTRSAQGRDTSYNYQYIAAGSTSSPILGAGGANLGGYQLTTTSSDGRSLIDRVDYFGRTTWHQDQGARQYIYNYNIAGQLASQTSDSGQNIQYSYFANGNIKEARDITERTLARYAYDNAGNRVVETYGGLAPDNVSLYGAFQADTISYDELNRMSRAGDGDGQKSHDVRYEYDAVGNRRSVRAAYWIPGEQSLIQHDHMWYTYDATNRFTTSKGSLTRRGTSMSDSTGQILQGTAGTLLRYDLAGQRIGVTNADGSVEAYSYSADGYLEDSRVNGSLRARRRVDSLGRTLQYSEWETNGNVRQIKTSAYDADNRTLSETTSGTNTAADGVASYKYYNDRSDGASSTLGAGSLAQVTFTPQQSGAPSTSTSYTYVYWDSAKQNSIYKKVGAGGPNNEGLTQLNYDHNGHLNAVADVNVGRTLNYFNSAQGQVLRRVESKAATATTAASTTTHNFYYAAGRRIGDVGNDGNSVRQSYAEQLAIPLQNPNTTAQSYKTQTPITSADFGQNYEPINASYPVATGSTYTVRGGDTLKSIAQQVWGDGAMWYLIADANHLSGSEVLVSGQTLVIPNKVTNIHNNASTFRPYNPGEVIGHIDPTIPTPPPPPQQDKGCGTIGTILMVVVAVVATIYTAGAAAGYFATAGSAAAGMGTAALGTAAVTGTAVAGLSTGAMLASAAIGAAAGSIASQAVGLMTGNVDKFSWSAVGQAALGGAITAGVGAGLNSMAQAGGVLNGTTVGNWVSSSANGAATSWQGAAIRAGLSSAATQAIQGHWSWREVGASAVAGAAGYAVGNSVGSALQGADQNFSKVAQSAIAGAAGGWASSQILGMNANETWARTGQGFISGFANGVGNALGESIASQSGPKVPAVASPEEKAAVLEMFERDAPSNTAGNGLRLGGSSGLRLPAGAVADWSAQVDRGIKDKVLALQNFDVVASKAWAREDAEAAARAEAARVQRNAGIDRRLAAESAAKASANLLLTTAPAGASADSFIAQAGFGSLEAANESARAQEAWTRQQSSQIVLPIDPTQIRVARPDYSNASTGFTADLKGGVLAARNMLPNMVEGFFGLFGGSDLSFLKAPVPAENERGYYYANLGQSVAGIALPALEGMRGFTSLGNVDTSAASISQLSMRERVLAKIEATRVGNASSQFELYATVEDLLNKRIDLGLTSNAKMQRNFAYSEYQLNGELGKDFALSGKSSPGGTVGIPENRMFSTMEVGWSRAYDTEVKLLESIAQRYNPHRLDVVPGLSGSVNLYSELTVCYSCSRVIGQFQEMFPNVRLGVQSGASASKPFFR
ncbi:deaminase domain-containing protein [Paucibacter sp. KBW04]|uniref:deaminase domain-containing protein n=1 Tax=Paucibacter sp. KBW04 TaxID=2153361 RepID=UPI0018CBFCBD|nr:deaminase domain-containing protein [Paucibacter sp. KBW04]